MSIVCQRCSNIYPPSPTCPRCGAASPARDLESAVPVHGPRWQQTVVGRLLIGLILAQGLFYGLRHLLTGVTLALGEGAEEALPADRHALALRTIQILGVMAGGLLAGGGQRHGWVLGAVVGLWNGVLASVLRQNISAEPGSSEFYMVPLALGVVGLIAGAAGSFLWKPIPLAAVPVVLAPPRRSPVVRRPSPFAGKIAWPRVAIGTAFAVVGYLFAKLAFERALDYAGSRWGTHSDFQDRLIIWEIKALAVILGGALAGATTSNGLKQGLVVGLASSFVLIGVQTPNTTHWLNFAVLTVVAMLTLAMAGGWFGGQLFPPVIKVERRRFADA